MKTLDWKGCYAESSKGYITAESFAHPAKMAVGLCTRIFQFLQSKKYIKKHDVIVDPFGGVGMTAIVGTSLGYEVVLVELEERFVVFTKHNLDKHRELWLRTDRRMPFIVQGDSRKLGDIIVFQRSAIVTSPPYLATQGGAKGIMVDGYHNEKKRKGAYDKVGKRTYKGQGGDRSRANIELLPEGTVGAVVTSPPFNEDNHNQIHGKGKGKHTYDKNEPKARMKKDYVSAEHESAIGRLPVDGVVTSPPWEKNSEGSRKGSKFKGDAVLKAKRGHGASDEAVRAQAKRDEEKTYGTSPGQIGQEQKETYWQAMAQVYSQCNCVLKPGGVIAIVVKDFIRNKERVRLVDNTVKLIEHCGFKVEYRIRAWLTEEQGTTDMFNGARKVKSRKSFFRRLHEKKYPHLAIDYEEVIIAVKPKKRPRRISSQQRGVLRRS